MNNEKPHGAEADLHHLVAVRVIHLGAVLLECEFVGKGFPRHDGFLSKPLNTVHAAGKDQAVPVHGGGLREFVGHKDADPVAFDRFNGGPESARCNQALIFIPGAISSTSSAVDEIP